MKSSSGGIFYELARNVLTENGLVIGAAFEQDGTVCLKGVQTEDQLICLLGSKYVQCQAEKAYGMVKAALKENRKVLFSGTPCQCNALLGYLGGAHPANLLIVDLICHGVPSEGVWTAYLSYLSRDKCSCSISFRDKRDGWGNFGLRAEFTDGTEYYMNHSKDTYYTLFVGGQILRPSCYTCGAKGENRSADITLGDFWGGQDLNPLGSSIVLVNTEFGRAGFGAIKHRIQWKEIPYESAVRKNKNYFEPCTIPFNREKVFHAFRHNPSVLFDHADDYIHTALAERICRKFLQKAEMAYHRIAPPKGGYLRLLDTGKEAPFSARARCCGCGACVAICPVKAITMKSDNEGFFYPSINAQLCCKCGKCRSVCIYDNQQERE